MKLAFLRFALSVIIAAICGPLTKAQVTPALTRAADSTIWRIQNRGVGAVNKAGRQGMRLDSRPGNGIAWLVGLEFASGTIEVDLRGSNTPGQSFLGVAFHGIDSTTYDAVYFRQFNFRSSDPARHTHSVQYISQSDFPWEKLRADSPGKYEQPITPPPDPDNWFHVRIVVDGPSIRVFVNSSATPSIAATALDDRHSGLVGLWVGNDSPGDFANLTITADK
jgi:hypothetical protein